MVLHNYTSEENKNPPGSHLQVPVVVLLAGLSIIFIKHNSKQSEGNRFWIPVTPLLSTSNLHNSYVKDCVYVRNGSIKLGIGTQAQGLTVFVSYSARLHNLSFQHRHRGVPLCNSRIAGHAMSTSRFNF